MGGRDAAFHVGTMLVASAAAMLTPTAIPEPTRTPADDTPVGANPVAPRMIAVLAASAAPATAPSTAAMTGSTRRAATTGPRGMPLAPSTPSSRVRWATVRVVATATSTTPTSNTVTAMSTTARPISSAWPSEADCARIPSDMPNTITTRNAPVAVVMTGSTISLIRRRAASQPYERPLLSMFLPSLRSPRASAVPEQIHGSLLQQPVHRDQGTDDRHRGYEGGHHAGGLQPRDRRSDVRNHQRHSGSGAEHTDEVGNHEGDRGLDEEEVEDLVGQTDAGHDAELTLAFLDGSQEGGHRDDKPETESDRGDEPQRGAGHLAGEQCGELLLERPRSVAPDGVVDQTGAVRVGDHR